MTFTKSIKSLASVYNKCSLWCKVLILTSLLLLVVLVFKGLKTNKMEGFEQRDKFLIKRESEVYDDFYADIYDYLVFNTLKNEYPELGGKYEVLHHTQLLQELIDSGRLTVEGGVFKGKKITFHDPCYLGRANNEYEAPRNLIQKLDAELMEMKRSRSNGLCCGAGGAQMFKEAEKGSKEVNMERTDDVLEVKPDVVAVGCPFCMTMLRDGVKLNEKENEIQVLDIAEMIAQAKDLV
jgi:hypothetical protein